MSTLVLVARPLPGERNLMVGAVGQQVFIDELLPVVGIDAAVKPDPWGRGHVARCTIERLMKDLGLHGVKRAKAPNTTR